MHVTVDTLLERVKAMAPMLRAYAAEAEAQRRLARPVVDAVSGLDHGTGHLASMRPPENQRLDTGKG